MRRFAAHSAASRLTCWALCCAPGTLLTHLPLYVSPLTTDPVHYIGDTFRPWLYYTRSRLRISEDFVVPRRHPESVYDRAVLGLLSEDVRQQAAEEAAERLSCAICVVLYFGHIWFNKKKKVRSIPSNSRYKKACFIANFSKKTKMIIITNHWKIGLRVILNIATAIIQILSV